MESISRAMCETAEIWSSLGRLGRYRQVADAYPGYSEGAMNYYSYLSATMGSTRMARRAGT
jgi:hypothetical protein